MPALTHTHISGPDFESRIWFPAPHLGGLRHRIWETAEFDFDLSPVSNRVNGRLLLPSSVAPGESTRASVWLRWLKDEELQSLRKGFQFTLMPKRAPRFRRSTDVVGYGVVTEVLDAHPPYFQADAVVAVDLDPQLAPSDTLMGHVFDFHFPDLCKTWAGHLDNQDKRKQTGDALLCLHTLGLGGPTARGPGGQPFTHGDQFEVYMDGIVCGRGTISRALLGNERWIMSDPSQPVRHPSRRFS